MKYHPQPSSMEKEKQEFSASRLEEEGGKMRHDVEATGVYVSVQWAGSGSPGLLLS